MEKLLKLDTLENIQAIICHYALDHFQWDGVGTAIGFSHHLLARGGTVDLSQLSGELEAYRYQCALQGTASVDAVNARETDGITGFTVERIQLRREASAAIRHFKLEKSAVYWNMLARLATVADRSVVVDALSADQCEGVLEAIDVFSPLLLTHFQACQPYSTDRAGLGYKPGEDSFMDEFVRQDIERFDRTLETAPPCAGSREDYFEEAAALYLLLEHTPIRAELSAVVAAQAMHDAVKSFPESLLGATASIQ